jgi:DNA-binding LacI/PurR family transcriptional regulator
MSQMELAKIAFEALLDEVKRESPLNERKEYEMDTNLVLRRSTALAHSAKNPATPRKMSPAQENS